MSAHNLYSELLDKQLDCPSSGKMFYVPSLSGHMFAWGSSVPADGATGYAKGCIFINTGGSDQSDTLYCNIGTGSSANFNAVTVASD